MLRSKVKDVAGKRTSATRIKSVFIICSFCGRNIIFLLQFSNGTERERGGERERVRERERERERQRQRQTDRQTETET